MAKIDCFNYRNEWEEMEYKVLHEIYVWELWNDEGIVSVYKVVNGDGWNDEEIAWCIVAKGRGWGQYYFFFAS